MVQAETSTGLQGAGTIVEFGGTFETIDPLNRTIPLRSNLSSGESWGQELPGGFGGPPDGTPSGGLFGMNWPFRDFLNFDGDPPNFPGGNDGALGNGNRDGGSFFNIRGRQNFAQYGARGNPGGGVGAAINCFSFDVLVTDFTPRTIVLTWNPSNTTPYMIRRADGTTFVPDVLPTETLRIDIVPAPGAAGVALGVVLCATRRRRSASPAGLLT